MRVAVYQGGVSGDVAGNVLLLREQVGRAVQEGADMVLFPELFLCGYSDGAKYAEPVDGPSFQEISAIAKHNAIHVVYGYAERQGSLLFNSLMVIDDHGACLLNYRKVHLYGELENSCFTHGDKLAPVIKIKGVNVGIMICWDLDFVEYSRILRLQEAQVLLVATATWDPITAEVVVRCRAYENQVFVCYSNRCDCEEGVTYTGDSCIAGPAGDIIAKAVSSLPQLIYADLQFDKYQYLQSYNPIFLHRRPDLYQNFVKASQFTV